MYLAGSQPIQHIPTSCYCVRDRSNSPQLPGCLCVPYWTRKNLMGFVLFVALFCYGSPSVSAEGFVMLQSFTGEHSNHMSLLHLSTSQMK